MTEEDAERCSIGIEHRQGRQGRCRLMAAPELAGTHGINEAIGITRELCQRGAGFDRSFLESL